MQGLLLDLGAATLTVWVNGERKGVMVRPNMANEDGEPIAQLAGPLRWAVDLDAINGFHEPGRRSLVSAAIAGPLPLPAA